MSSGSRGVRSSVTSNHVKNVSSAGNKTVATDNGPVQNSSDKSARAAPTPEQIRMAQITDNFLTSQQDQDLQEKIEQVIQVTGRDREEALVALHDHSNDLEAAVNAILEGNTNQEAWHERTKKKKPKAKSELESNKENRRGGTVVGSDGRDRSASRGRGGGGRGGSSRGGRREGGGDVGSSRGRRGGGRGLANGSGPVRGRGGRAIRGGRGGAVGSGGGHLGDTFHSNRQNPSSFDETIETWAEPSVGKIDTFGDAGEVAGLGDWGDEWTGSLDKTNVFVHSSVEPTPPPASDLTATDAAKLVNSSCLQNYQQQPAGSVASSSPQSYSAATGSAANQSYAGSASVLMPGQQQQQQSGLTDSAAIDLTALLQQAAPQAQHAALSTGRSLLSGSTTANGNAVHLQQQQPPQQPPLQQQQQQQQQIPLPQHQQPAPPQQQQVQQQQQTPSILRGISTNVGDVIKSSVGISTLSSSSAGGLSSLSAAAGALSYPGSVSSSSVPYSSAGQHSIFSSGLQNEVARSLGASLNNNNNNSSSSSSTSKSDSKPGVILPGVVPPMVGQRPKPARSKAPPTSSKIPESAVEMPEDAMGALNLQLSGLKFGTDGFDFIPEPNKSSPSAVALSSADASYPPPAAPSVSSSYTNNSPYVVEASAAAGSPAYGTSVAAAAPPSVSAVPSSYSNSSYPYASASLNSYSNSSHPTSNYSLPSGLERAESATNSAVKPSQNNSYSSNGQDGSSGGDGSYNSSAAVSNALSGHQSNSAPVAAAAAPDSGQVVSASSTNSFSSSYGTVSNSGGQQGTQSQQEQQQQQQQYLASGTGSSAAVQYQNSYNTSSHSSLSASMNTKALAPLKDASQSSYNSGESNVSAVSSSTPAPSSNLSLQASSGASQHQVQQQQQHKAPSTSVPPPGVPQQQTHHHQQQSTHIAAQHQAAAAVAQQQILLQQQQQQQQQQHQFVNNNAAPLQPSTMPFFPSMIYSFEELQMLQQRMPHLAQQVPSTLAGTRDASGLSAGAYSAADMTKFRTDQNSSPVPSAINTQGGHAGPYIANAGSATAMHPLYMYHHQNVAVPNTFAQYATPAIIQLPANTGSNTSQFQPQKLQYNAAAPAPTYYDSQGAGDYKAGYSSGSQAASKQGVGSSQGTMNSSVSDLPPYKNHLTKSYEKSGFHTSTPPPFNMPGSAGAPYAHPQVYLPQLPQPQHHTNLMHHQLHQDGGSSSGQRGSSSGGQSKTGSKGYPGQFWGNS